MKRITFLIDSEEDHNILKRWCLEDGYETNLSMYIRQMIQIGHESHNNRSTIRKSIKPLKNIDKMTLDELFKITEDQWDTISQEDRDKVKARQKYLFDKR